MTWYLELIHLALMTWIFWIAITAYRRGGSLVPAAAIALALTSVVRLIS